MTNEPLNTPPVSPKSASQLALAVVPKTTQPVLPIFHMFRSTIEGVGQVFKAFFISLNHAVLGEPYDQNDVDIAIRKLKGTLAFIEDKLVMMREKVEHCSAHARAACAQRDKAAALHQLRLRTMYERECNKVNALRFNIESNILHMESVGVMMETVSTIKDTRTQFKTISRHVNISKLEESIEEMFEQNDASTSIEEALNDLNTGINIDDSALQEELNQMMSDCGSSTPPPPVAPARLEPSITAPTLVFNMPEAPTFQPKAAVERNRTAIING